LSKAVLCTLKRNRRTCTEYLLRNIITLHRFTETCFNKMLFMCHSCCNDWSGPTCENYIYIPEAIDISADSITPFWKLELTENVVNYSNWSRKIWMLH